MKETTNNGRKMLSLLLALVMTLALLPVSTTFAEETLPSESYTQEATADEAVLEVQALIDALPTLETVSAEDYDALQEAYDRYELLQNEQKKQIAGAEVFEELFQWFSAQTVLLGNGGVSYLDADGATQSCEQYTTLTAETTTLNTGWYVASGTLTINDTLTLASEAEIHLILEDGATLTVQGIKNDSSALTNLTIYAQSKGENAGKLVVSGYIEEGAAYGIDVYGNLTVNGGVIEVSTPSLSKSDYTGSAYSTAISVIGSYVGTSGIFTVNGASVTASAGDISVTGTTAVSYGVLAFQVPVRDGGALKAFSGDVSAMGDSVEAGSSFGVSSLYGKMEIDNATLEATAGTVTVEGKRRVRNGTRQSMSAGSFGILLTMSDFKVSGESVVRATARDTTVTRTDNEPEETADESQSYAIFLNTVVPKNLEISGGSFTLAHGTASYTGGTAGTAKEGDMKIAGDDDSKASISGGLLKLKQAYFKKLEFLGGVEPTSILASGSAYATTATPFVLLKPSELSSDAEVQIVECTHQKRDNTPAYENSLCPYCGEACPHSGGFQNATHTCETCGASCPHKTVNNAGLCSDCNTQLAVQVVRTISQSPHTTETKVFSTFAEALASVDTDDIASITLYTDVTAGDLSIDKTALTLKLNGHKLTANITATGGLGIYNNATAYGTLDGTVSVSGVGILSTYGNVMFTGKVTCGSIGSFLEGSVFLGGIETKVQDKQLNDYLPDKTVFAKQSTAGGEYDTPINAKTTAITEAVKVIAHEQHKQPASDGLHCLCGESVCVSITNGSNVTYYSKLQDVTSAVKTGDELKLLQNITDTKGYEFNPGTNAIVTINLNGKTLTVGSLTLKSGAFTVKNGSVVLNSDFGSLMVYEKLVVEESVERISRLAVQENAVVSLYGGSYGKIDVSGSITVFDLLPQGYAYKDSTGNWVAPSSDKTRIENVTVKKIPLTDMDVEKNKENYTYGETALLTAKPTLVAGVTETISYKWYRVSGSTETVIPNETSATLSVELDEVETFTYKCVATADGYSLSDEISFAVGNATFTDVSVQQKGTLTYDGTAQQATVSASATAKNNQTVSFSYSTEENGTYKAELPRFTNADSYTVYYKASAANHVTKGGSFTVKIEQRAIAPSVTAESKTYDGNTSAVVRVAFQNLATGETLTKDVDYTLEASFDSKNVGIRTVYANIMLKNSEKAKNYILTTDTANTQENITKAELQITSAAIDNKSYDGNKNATVTGVSFSGLVNGETFEINRDYTASGLFDDENFGENKNVTVSVSLATSDLASNYALSDKTASGKANIIALTAIAPTFADRGTPYTGAAITHEPITVPFTGVTAVSYTYEGKEGTVYAASSSAPTHAGKYTVTASFTMEKGYAQLDPLTATLTIEKATLTVNPEKKSGMAWMYSGKALFEAKMSTYAEFLGVDEQVVEGSYAWVDGTEIINAPTAARMRFTDRDGNYEPAEFSVSINLYSTGGGSSKNSNITTNTKKNADGSVTTITTNKITGTVTEVTKYTDGSTVTIEIKKDGTVTTVEKDRYGNQKTTVEHPNGTLNISEENKDGSEKKIEKDAEGNVTTTEKDKAGNTTVSTETADGSKTTEEKRADGTTVKTETAQNGETTSEITAPEGEETEVDIPVDGAEKIEKLIVTDQEGNRKEITDFERTDSGVRLCVSGSCFVECVRETQTAKKEFADVHAVSHWAIESIDYVYEAGLMNGITENEFKPDMPLTRAMLATILYRAANEPMVDEASGFDDIASESYYAKAVAWAEQNDIVSGVSETEFAPDENITREQIATIIYRFAKSMGIAPQGAWAIRLDYADISDISDYAVEGIMYCTLQGIMQGKDNHMFAPKAIATRAEIAAILQRLMEENK